MIVQEIIKQDSLSKLDIVKRTDVLNFLDIKLKYLEQFKVDKYLYYIFWGKSKNDIYIE